LGSRGNSPAGFNDIDIYAFGQDDYFHLDIPYPYLFCSGYILLEHFRHQEFSTAGCMVTMPALLKNLFPAIDHSHFIRSCFSFRFL